MAPGGIVGIVLAILIVALCLVGGVLFYRRRRNRNRQQEDSPLNVTELSQSMVKEELGAARFTLAYDDVELGEKIGQGSHSFSLRFPIPFS